MLDSKNKNPVPFRSSKSSNSGLLSDLYVPTKYYTNKAVPLLIWVILYKILIGSSPLFLVLAERLRYYLLQMEVFFSPLSNHTQEILFGGKIFRCFAGRLSRGRWPGGGARRERGEVEAVT